MSREKSPETEQGRRERVPFGSHRRKLSVHKKDPNYVYRWFNDVGSRILEAQEAGYQFVTKQMLGETNVGDPDVHNQNQDLNSRVSKKVNETLTVYLMRTKKTFYDEDFSLKQKEADAVDEAIFKGGADKVNKSYGLDVNYRR